MLHRYKKTILLIGKIALMTACFWLAIRGINITTLNSMLAGQSHSAIVIASLAILVQSMFGAVRWQSIMLTLAKAHNIAEQRIVPFSRALRDFYISCFVNCCLPGTVGGDVVRVWLIKSDKTPLPVAISSVVLDRLMALFALGVMGFCTIPVLASYLGLNIWLSLFLCGTLGIMGLWLLFHLDHLPVLRSANWLEYFLHNLRLLRANSRMALTSLVFAIFGHSCYCLFVYITASSLGIHLSFIDSLTLVPWVLLAAIIPFSIGGWGLREAAMVYMLGLASIPQEAALTISVQLGIASIITSLPAGFLWLASKKRKTE